MTKRMAEITKNKNSFYKSFEESHDDYYRIKKKEKPSTGEKVRKFLYRKFYKYGYGVDFISDPDEIIEENAVITINNEAWKIFHSPGHAIDHISLYNGKRGILLAGDNILRSKTTWLGPPGSDIHDYINTLKHVLELPKLNIILPAHGSPIEQPKKRVEEILSHRNKRTNQVLNVIRECSIEGVTLKEITHSLYPNISRFMRDVTRGWISLTLKMLEKKKLIRKEKNLKKRDYIFFPTS
jgi:glyoxylase-like metal-dependent hydrolase (beta-lactamase superfamily II)